MAAHSMTESDDKTRWILAYVLFGVAEITACVSAYEADGRNHLMFHLSYALPFLAVLPLFLARKTLTLYGSKTPFEQNLDFRLDVSFRLWQLVIFSYVLLIAALSVGNLREDISGQ